MISVCERTAYYMYIYIVGCTRNLIAIDIYSKNKINRIEKMETERLKSQKVQSTDGIDMISTDVPTSMTVVPLLYNYIILLCHRVELYTIK